MEHITTGPIRVSFPNVFVAKSVLGGDPTFSITMMFDKKNKDQMTDLKKIHKMAELAFKDKWPDPKKAPRVPLLGDDKSPIKDADKNKNSQGVPLNEKNPEYAGHYILRASCKEDYPPTVIDRSRQEILKKSEIYGGCICRVNFNAFAYDHTMNKGVTFGLNGVQKWEDGESFGGGRPPVDSMFDEDDEFVDPLNDDDDPLGESEEDISF